MVIRLSENIRAFRKARSLTQEQLAEVLGVTVGAVYKWEAGLSAPELNTIMELADFFDTSVDVLLGYEMKDNRLLTTVERLRQYRMEKDQSGLAEAEKALKKYPNAFPVVHNSASLYRVFGVARGDRKLLNRALELLKASRLLLPQNVDPQIGESSLSIEMAEVLVGLGRSEEAVEILKKNNAGGVCDDLIGMILAGDCNRAEEALPHLSAALFRNTASLIRIVMGYINVFFARKDYRQAQEILEWSMGALSGLKDGDKPTFLDKVDGVLSVCLAYAQLKSGRADDAHSTLLQARRQAQRYDEAPDRQTEHLRFVTEEEQIGVYDDIGTSGMEGIRYAVASMEDPALNAMWKEIDDNE